MNKLLTLQFIKYTSIGTTTFLLDLFLLYILTNKYGTNYLSASGFSFVIAVSINYFTSRQLVFKNTTRGWIVGYLNFILIALFGLYIIICGMYILVDIFGLPIILSRVLLACIVGIWNYSMNLVYNFKII